MYDIGALFNSNMKPSVIYSYWKQEPTEAERSVGKMSLRTYAAKHTNMSWVELLKPKNRDKFRTLYSSISVCLKYIDTTIGVCGADLDRLREKWGFAENNQPFFRLFAFILNGCNAEKFLNKNINIKRFCAAYEIYKAAPPMIHERRNILALPYLTDGAKMAFAATYNAIIDGSSADDSPAPEESSRSRKKHSSSPVPLPPAQEMSLPPDLVFFEGFMKRFSSDELTILHKYIGDTLSKK